MKQFALILTLLSVLVCQGSLLYAAALVEPQDTLDRYVIDNKQVEQFDGGLLEGRTIVSYRILTYNSPSEGIYRVHDIRTEESAPAADPAYVVNGKQVSKHTFQHLSPSKIKSMTVIRNGAPEVRQYAGWENGVILVETNQDDALETEVQIGYGTAADSRELSVPVSSVKPEDTEFYTNIYDYLRSKVPGIQIHGESIVIRGIGTMNSSSDPLILVDGVETQNIGLLDPHDIYSVDVLKDASASIYGLKGANGVILITTRTGRQAKSQKAR